MLNKQIFTAILSLSLLNSIPAWSQSITTPPQNQERITSKQPELDVGIISLPSSFSVKTTSSRLLEQLRKEKFTVFADIDHQGNAKSVQLTLRPTRMILFGNPKIGTLLMHENQTMGIDLPLKFMVWETIDHRVYISWNNPYYLAKRHGISPQFTLLSKMSAKLYALAKQAGNK